MGIEEWILIAIVLLPGLIIVFDDGNLSRGNKK